MKRLLYVNEVLNVELMEESGDPRCEKSVFIHLANKIFNPEFFIGIGEGDIYIAFTELFYLSTSKNSSIGYISEHSPVYRYNTLIEKATSEYWTIITNS